MLERDLWPFETNPEPFVLVKFMSPAAATPGTNRVRESKLLPIGRLAALSVLKLCDIWSVVASIRGAVPSTVTVSVDEPTSRLIAPSDVSAPTFTETPFDS